MVSSVTAVGIKQSAAIAGIDFVCHVNSEKVSTAIEAIGFVCLIQTQKIFHRGGAPLWT